MRCAICEKELCGHGIVHVHGFALDSMNECIFCGAVDFGRRPGQYCLPIYEGRVDFNSDVFGTVCQECHDRYCTTSAPPKSVYKKEKAPKNRAKMEAASGFEPENASQRPENKY